jgi:predicted ATPase
MTSDNDVSAKIKELESLAKTVLDLKNEVIPRRPIVIEFCGSPKSGKTSCINSLDLFLRRNKFRTRVQSERASVCPVRKKYDPYYNFWTVTSAVAELSEVLSNHSKDYDVVMMDRGIFDALCWFKWLLSKNHIDEHNFKSVECF